MPQALTFGPHHRGKVTVRTASWNAPLMAFVMMLSTWCLSEASTGVGLAIAPNGTNAILSWPYPSTAFGLEFSTNLIATNWQPIVATAVSNNGRWEVTVPLNGHALLLGTILDFQAHLKSGEHLLSGDLLMHHFTGQSDVFRTHSQTPFL